MQWPGPVRSFLKRPIIRGATYGIVIGFSAGSASAMLLTEYHVSEVKLPLIAFSRPDRSRAELEELRARLRAETDRIDQLNELIASLRVIRPRPGASSPPLNTYVCTNAPPSRPAQ